MPKEPEARALPGLEASTDKPKILIRHKRKPFFTPSDFPKLTKHTIHNPCDIDYKRPYLYVPKMPNQCITVYNHRWCCPSHHRAYKLYQLEGFMFGQFYERLKRHETEPRVFYKPRTLLYYYDNE
ncbi:hypothetical protein KR009_005343 [Drosophila setifemur]|nr:hypothetical protein KR009_005343 [Drosophila setifemur]